MTDQKAAAEVEQMTEELIRKCTPLREAIDSSLEFMEAVYFHLASVVVAIRILDEKGASEPWLNRFGEDANKVATELFNAMAADRIRQAASRSAMTN